MTPNLPKIDGKILLRSGLKQGPTLSVRVHDIDGWITLNPASVSFLSNHHTGPRKGGGAGRSNKSWALCLDVSCGGGFKSMSHISLYFGPLSLVGSKMRCLETPHCWPKHA